MSMMDKVMTKKSFAIGFGLLPILFFFLLRMTLQVCDFYSSCFDTASSVFLATTPLLATLLVAIPAYFLRKEVHDFWFKWMMCIYMPIACAIVFWIAYAVRDSVNSGFGPQLNGIEPLLAVAGFSVLFIILSVILIVAKYDSLKRKQGA